MLSLNKYNIHGGGDLVGALIVEAGGINKPKLKLDIELSNIINRWEHQRKRDIRIFDKEGNKYLLCLINFEEWDNKLKKINGE